MFRLASLIISRCDDAVKVFRMLALTALVLLDIGIVVSLWWFGCARLWGLIREG